MESVGMRYKRKPRRCLLNLSTIDVANIRGGMLESRELGTAYLFPWQGMDSNCSSLCLGFPPRCL